MLMPNFSAMAFFSALEPLRIANRLAGLGLYSWTIHAPRGDHAAASNGMQLRVDGPMPDAAPTAIVCAGFDPLNEVSPRLLDQLRRAWRAGGQVGAIDTGAFVLAEAGILGRKPITLHWEAAAEFRRRYPHIPVSTEIYERHARLFTCAGGTAAMDMMLDSIASLHGIELASAVSDQLIHDRIRPPSAPQRTSLAQQTAQTGPVIQRLAAAMKHGVEAGSSLLTILAAEGVSRRQAERFFNNRLATTPGRFYLEMRIRHALVLMRNDGLTVHEAAMSAGFSSQPAFSRACKRLFNLSPRNLLFEGVKTGPPDLTIGIEQRGDSGT